MKRIDLPLSQLTFAQKLDLMETIWGDLVREEKTLGSPAWHEAVLRDRKEALSAGKVTVSDWEEAKERTINNLNKLMSFLPSFSLLVDHITRYAHSSRLEYNKKSY